VETDGGGSFHRRSAAGRQAPFGKDGLGVTESRPRFRGEPDGLSPWNKPQLVLGRGQDRKSRRVPGPVAGSWSEAVHPITNRASKTPSATVKASKSSS